MQKFKNIAGGATYSLGFNHSREVETNVVNSPSTFGRGWREVPGEGSIKNASTLAEVLITISNYFFEYNLASVRLNF